MAVSKSCYRKSKTRTIGMTDKKPKYQIERTTVFRKDLKKAKKRGLDLSLLDNIG